MPADNRLKLSRRQFIISLASGLAATITLQGCGSPVDRSVIAQRLARTIGDQTAAKRFGVAYLRAYPDEAGIELLVELIDDSVVGEYGQGMSLTDSQLLAEHLNKQVRDEYRRGEAIQVDGWILSRTEARLYALSALLLEDGI